jgi:ABC-type microcin C transport system permease subunit YejE
VEVRKNNMDFDNRISFLAGFIFTAATSISIMGLVQAAFLGLIGGFFGLLGKEAYYYVKGEIKRRLNDDSEDK